MLKKLNIFQKNNKVQKEVKKTASFDMFDAYLAAYKHL